MSDFVLTNKGATIIITNISTTILLKVENGIISPTLINKNLNETGEVPVYAIQVPSFMSYKYNTIQPGDSITFESTNKDEILYYYGISKNPFAGISVTVTPNGGSEENAQFIATEEAFTVKGNLKTLTIPEGVTSIKAGEFGGGACKVLETVIIPEGVTEIGTGMFANCELLKNVTIPESVKSIGISAFNPCKSLESIKLPEGLESIGMSSFSGSGLKSLVVPQNVTSIGSYAFTSCNALEIITINKPEGSIEGAPWGAPETTQIIWNG